MAVSVTLPALGESVSEGTVTRWLKAEGERVEADEPLLEVSTDKVDTEIPAPASGTLSSIKVAEDETVEVGAELAVIDDGDDAPAAAPSSGGAEAAAPAEPEREPEPASRPAEQQAPAQSEPAEPAPARAAAPAQEAPAQEAPAQQSPSQEPPAQQEPSRQEASQGGSAEGTDVVLPALGESVTEGTVTRWLKQVGDQVEADEPLLEVSTDKVDTEIPAPASGTLLEVLIGEDETAEVGARLAVIGSASASAPQAAAPTAPAEAPAAAPEPAPEPARPAPAEPAQPPAAQAPAQPAPAPRPAPAAPAPQPAAPAAPAAQAPAAPAPARAPAPTPPAPRPAAPAQPAAPARVPAPANGVETGGAYVTPLVRKLAADSGVDLSTVRGTGVGGRIRKQDVLSAAEAAKAAAQARTAEPAAGGAGAASALRGQTLPMTRIRKVIGQNMMKALHSQAQLSTVVEVDVTRLMRLRRRAKDSFLATEGVKLSPMPFFVKAAAEALKSHPSVNARINDDGTVTYHDVENIGIAVDTERGLMVPVLKGAGDLNIAGIAKRTAELAEKVRNRTATPDDLSGGTFTISNTGSRGALFDTIIVNYPQVAELGVGATVRRPVVVDHPDLGETIAIRDMVYLTLSYDHQLVDGADAARYLADVRARLEAGEFEGELGL